MKIDLHELTLNEAIDEIFYNLYECCELGVNKIEIVHGYKHGTRIKDYIQSGGLLNEATKRGYKVSDMDCSDQGMTILHLSPTKIENQTAQSDSKVYGYKKETNINFCFKCNRPMIFLKDLLWYKCEKCGKLKK